MQLWKPSIGRRTALTIALLCLARTLTLPPAAVAREPSAKAVPARLEWHVHNGRGVSDEFPPTPERAFAMGAAAEVATVLLRRQRTPQAVLWSNW